MSTLAETPTFISAAEAAELLHVAPRTIRRWADQGRLTRFRLGPRASRFDLDEVVGLIADSANPPLLHAGDGGSGFRMRVG